MDEMLQAAAMVAAFLLLLGLLHCLGKAHYKFLSHTLDSIRVFTASVLFLISTVFFQMCNPYSKGPSRLGAFQLS